LTHVVPALHAFPHVPQLLSSSSVPLGHAQVPLMHCSPWLHATPHLPQLVLSLAVLTQAVPHCVLVGDAQLMAHALPLHAA
jgi:hypothetical protein